LPIKFKTEVIEQNKFGKMPFDIKPPETLK